MESEPASIDSGTQSLIDKLTGTVVAGCKVGKYVDRGASALVFEAEREGNLVAIKVFDPEFLKRFSDEVQPQRIERQLLLKDKQHPNLVDIIDGGYCKDSDFHFLVMPILRAPSLEKVLGKVPRDRIRPLLSQIADAAQYLESLDLIHRDIKPANIAVDTDYQKATLLDLGVIRPLGLSDLTDTTDTTPFVGTTRYSPPEFLLREMDNTTEAWRALTFYQLGAVLHDLLTVQKLFHGRTTPYARLVRAVLIEEPDFENCDAPHGLIRLAQCCLVKDPTRRLALVSWESFSPRPQHLSVDDLRTQIARLRKGTSDHAAAADASSGDLTRELESFFDSLCASIRQHCIDDTDMFPPVTLQTIPTSNPQSRAFSLTFDSSNRHRMQSMLHCAFNVVLLDTAPAIFQLSGSAGTSDGSLDVTGEIPFAFIYEGPEGEAAKEAALRLIYTGIRDTIAVVGVVTDSSSAPSAVWWHPTEGST